MCLDRLRPAYVLVNRFVMYIVFKRLPNPSPLTVLHELCRDRINVPGPFVIEQGVYVEIETASDPHYDSSGQHNREGVADWQ